MQPPALGTTDALTSTLERFRGDLALYAKACLVIRDKEAHFHPLELNAAQAIVQGELTKQLQETGRVRAIILKARQEGISTLVAARFFRSIHLRPGIVSMVVADSLIRAGALYDIYARYLEHLPLEIKPVKKAVARQRLLAFTHDSELSVRPATDTEAGRAMTIHRLHASELAYWGPGAVETWISLMQAVPSKGSEVIIESTAKGAGGLFHELWESAQDPDSGWNPIFLPWWIHEEYEAEPAADLASAIAQDPDDFEAQAQGGGLDYRGKIHKLSLRKLAWRRLVITEKFGGDPTKPNKDAIRAFQQEYPATAEEAFLVSGSCFFDEEQLRILSRRGLDPDTRGRLVRREDGKVGIEPSIRGAVRLWEPVFEQRHYVIGGDTAEGILVSQRRSGDAAFDEAGGRDYSTAQVIRLAYQEGDVHHPARVVAELHGRLAPEIFAEQVRLLGEMYSCGTPRDGTYRAKGLVGIERSHSSGQTVLRLLNEHYRYSPLYWHREINRRTRKVGRRIGWVTDVTSRMPMLDELAQAIREDLIEIPSKDLLREMVTFVIWENGKPMAEEGCHDDRVMALAIAWQMAVREHKHGRNLAPKPYDPGDTLTGM